MSESTQQAETPAQIDLYTLKWPEGGVGENDPIRQQVIDAVEKAATSNPRAVLETTKDWFSFAVAGTAYDEPSGKQSRERAYHLVMMAVDKAMDSDPAIVYDSSDQWRNFCGLQPQKSWPIVVDAAMKTVEKHPERLYTGLGTHDNLKKDLKGQLDNDGDYRAIVHRANLSLADSQPLLLFKGFDAWKDDVTAEQKREILTRAVKTTYATEYDPLQADHHVHYTVRRCESMEERKLTGEMITAIKQELGIARNTPEAASPIHAQANPVFAMIYGDNLRGLSYSDVVKQQVACEKVGQDFLLIPAPKKNEKGELIMTNGPDGPEYVPGIPLQDLSNRHIDDALYDAFRPGGEFSGREFTGYILTHGQVAGDSHRLSYRQHSNEVLQDVPDSIDSTVVFDSMLQLRDTQGNNLCRGVFMGACHGGASVSDMEQSLRNHPITRPVHLFAATPFDDVASQNDAGSFLSGLSTLAKDQSEFSAENLKSLYLERADSGNSLTNKMPDVVEKHFRPGEEPQGRWTQYENFAEKLQYILDNKEDFIAFCKDDPKALLRLERLNSARSAHAMKYSDSYYDQLLFADKTFDAYAADKGISTENAFISPDLLRVYKGDYAHLTQLPPQERTAVLTELAMKETAADVLRDYRLWKTSFSDVEQEAVLEQATKTYVSLDAPLRSNKQYEIEKSLSGENLALLLRHFSRHSENIFTQLSVRWGERAVDAAKLEPHYDAIVQNLTAQAPDKVLKHLDFLASHYPPSRPKEEFTAFIDAAAAQAAKDTPMTVLQEKHGKLAAHLGEAKAQEYTRQAVKHASEDNPYGLLMTYGRWESLYTEKEKYTLVKSALRQGGLRQELYRIEQDSYRYADPRKAGELHKMMRAAASDLEQEEKSGAQKVDSVQGALLPSHVSNLGRTIAMSVLHVGSEDVLGNLKPQTPVGSGRHVRNSGII